MLAIRYNFIKTVDFGPATDPISHFEAFVIATKIENLHETENRLQQIFSRNIFIRKCTKSTFFPKMSIFGLKHGDFSYFWRVFGYLFLDFKISNSEKHSCQISTKMNNIEKFYKGGGSGPSMLLMLNGVKM